ncbi:glycosyltransferase family 2 protein [Calothrix sp. 336/3]|uniref:glycosyltransferase family 2 protein n=1 Tax=Calothrix sp. 336/3 TaxID=1337936 RepID=UPI0004E2F1DD|nr:glycosyltransferase family 2 protein [Calothrix sp. 336/3]AKG22777.1 glycosyl transferase [Calothrix sp. 336/3]
MLFSQLGWWLINGVLGVAASIVLVICLHFLIECSAALLPFSGKNYQGRWQDTQVAVLVPAHNEELVIADTLAHIIPQLKSQDRVVVIADNCSDATAEIARGTGAVVIERHDRTHQGKGYALDYGLDFLAVEPPDIVVFIDADCIVQGGAIAMLSEWAIASNRPIQGNYFMAKPQSNPSAKDFISQFSIIIKNIVRSQGLTNLGQSSLLLGTGMAFPWQVIRSVNMASGHLVEDMKLGLDLTIAGYPTIFCPEAQVTANLPSQQQAAKSQRTRWVHGHLQAIRTYVPRLITEAITQKRFDLLVCLLDLCIPPLSLLTVIWLMVMLITLLFAVWGMGWTAVAIATIAGCCFLTAVIIAWAKFARQELPLSRLLAIPGYLLWKIPIYLKFVIKPQSKWVRTDRN